MAMKYKYPYLFKEKNTEWMTILLGIMIYPTKCA